MSAPKALNNKTTTLPQPPPRNRPNSTLIVSKSRKTHSTDRSRSRSANPPNRPSPSPPTPARARGIANAKSYGKTNKKPPIPTSKKPPIPTSKKPPKPPRKRGNSKNKKKIKKKSIKTKSKPSSAQRAHTPAQPAQNPPVAWRRNKNKSSISRKYAKKQLPPSSIKHIKKPKAPLRNRAKSSSNVDVKSQPPAATHSPEIDERPSLKPSLSANKRNKEKDNIIIHLKPETSPKKPPKTFPKTVIITEQKQSQNMKKPPSKPQPKLNPSGHHRDYSVIKTIPTMFKSKGYESPRNRNRNKRSKQIQSSFGLNTTKRSKRGFATKYDKRDAVMKGSCQCGAIKYELLSLPQDLQHCYCSMCRKMHGSVVATWTPFLENDIRFIKSAKQTQYRSSDKVTRSFCSICGSNISLKYAFQYDTLWLTPSLFDIKTEKAANWWLNVRVLHIFCGDKCEWYDIPDDGHPHLTGKEIGNMEVNGEPRFMYQGSDNGGESWD